LLFEDKSLSQAKQNHAEAKRQTIKVTIEKNSFENIAINEGEKQPTLTLSLLFLT
jgi:hypothetical protein